MEFDNINVKVEKLSSKRNVSDKELQETIENLKKINPKVNEWADIFDVYDNIDKNEKQGFILTTEVSDLLKSLDVKISEVEIGQLIKENDKEHTGIITKKEFLEIFAHYGNCFDSIDIYESFKLFDEHTQGLVDDQQLIDILSNFGEKLTKDEVIKLLREIDYDGTIPYSTFIKNNAIL